VIGKFVINGLKQMGFGMNQGGTVDVKRMWNRKSSRIRVYSLWPERLMLGGCGIGRIVEYGPKIWKKN
jgi:hypothetical protein